MQYQELQNLIPAYEVITFDVFDTLLKRIFSSPEDLFHAVQEQAQSCHDFVNRRKKAERTARKQCEYREVNLDEIYRFLEPVYGKEQTETLKNIEIATEINSALPNLDILPFYEQCRKSGKKIYIISDMYLPGKIVGKMLEHIHVNGYDKLYVSCDYRKTKWESGALFDVVMQENHIQPKQMLHIGDNQRADITMPRQKGIKAFQVKQVPHVRYGNDGYLHHDDKREFSRLENFISGTMPRGKGLAFRDGYEVFGPLLYQYSIWLKEQVKKQQINKILFFARDGYILQKAYRILDDKTETEYFYASRRAVIVPLLAFSNSLQEVLHLYRSWPKEIKISSFLNRVGLTPIQFQTEVKKYGFSLDDKLYCDTLLQNQAFTALYEALRPQIIATARQQYRLFMDYFQKSCDGKSIAMVDIGAGRSIELALRELLKRTHMSPKLYGLYFLMNEKENNNSKAYLDTEIQIAINNKLRFCYLFLEIFLSAPHGTVLGYRKTGKGIEPVFGDYDYAEESVKQDAQAIQQIQEGAVEFLKNRTAFQGFGLRCSQETAFAAFFNFGLFPKKEDIGLWGDFHFNADTFDSLAHPKTVSYYAMHPKVFMKEYSESYWPAGFLCRLLHSHFYNRWIVFLYQFIKKNRG